MIFYQGKIFKEDVEIETFSDHQNSESLLLALAN